MFPLKLLFVPSVGLAVVLVGLVLLRSHIVAWRRNQNDGRLDDHDRLHYYRQFRRRMTTSSLLVLLGLLIGFGDLLPWNRMPLFFSIYWGAVLLLALWVILLAVGDIASNRLYTRVALDRIRLRQFELEREVAEHRRKSAHRGNGHHS